MAAWKGWESQFLQRAGLPDTPRNRVLLRGWQASEGGAAAFNPLNTTTHEAGSTAYNSNGGTPVQNFRSRQDGIDATVKTLFNGNYSPILAALKRGNASYQEFGAAVNSSPWGTHGGYIAEWSGGARSTPSAAQPIVAAHLNDQLSAPTLLSQDNGRRQAALQMLQQSNNLLHANGQALQGLSLAQLVKDRKAASAMTQVGAQSGVRFLDNTGGAAQANPRTGGVIQLAKQYIGTKYVFGGASPQTGFDCSGFVQYVYGLKGVALPRTSQQQFHAGQPVNPNQLQPGDLLFFAGSDGTVQSPGHVTMYIGNGQMIASPHTGDVVHISNVNLGPGSGFSGARRVA